MTYWDDSNTFLIMRVTRHDKLTTALEFYFKELYSPIATHVRAEYERNIRDIIAQYQDKYPSMMGYYAGKMKEYERDKDWNRHIFSPVPEV